MIAILAPKFCLRENKHEHITPTRVRHQLQDGCCSAVVRSSDLRNHESSDCDLEASDTEHLL